MTAVAAALVGSYWIDYLYRRPNAPLSFPDSLNGTHTFRKIFLTVIFFFSSIYCAKMPPLDFIFHVTAAFFLAVIVVTDCEQYIIFDMVLLPFALLGILFTLLSETSFLERLSAAFCGGAFFFALLLLTKNGIGGGDVKLVATLGLWLGAEGLLETVLTSSIFGGICAFFLLLSGMKKRTDFFAYGPYICLAAAWQLFIP